ncbi:hypothetical protein D3C74_437320 [compost metagenome]
MGISIPVIVIVTAIHGITVYSDIVIIVKVTACNQGVLRRVTALIDISSPTDITEINISASCDTSLD